MTTVNRSNALVWHVELNSEDAAIINAAAAAAWSAALQVLPNGEISIWNKKYEEVESGAGDAVGHVVGVALTPVTGWKRPRINTRNLRVCAMHAALNALMTPDVLAVIARVYTEVLSLGETTEKAHGMIKAVVYQAIYKLQLAARR